MGWEKRKIKAETNPDVVVIGAGIGGSAIAWALAQSGLDVLILEKTTVHKDVVRGEWMAPWGVLDSVASLIWALPRCLQVRVWAS